MCAYKRGDTWGISYFHNGKRIRKSIGERFKAYMVELPTKNTNKPKRSGEDVNHRLSCLRAMLNRRRSLDGCNGYGMRRRLEASGLVFVPPRRRTVRRKGHLEVVTGPMNTR